MIIILTFIVKWHKNLKCTGVPQNIRSFSFYISVQVESVNMLRSVKMEIMIRTSQRCIAQHSQLHKGINNCCLLVIMFS